MTERKWTSGGWTAYEFGGEWYIATSDEDSGPIFKINGPSHERPANAHLIAASPDLYEALMDVVGYAGDECAPDDDPDYGKNVKAAHAALAKARGESDGYPD